MRDEAPRPAFDLPVVGALVAVQVVFASWSIVGKVALGAVPPTALVTARLLGGALFFGAWNALRGAPVFAPSGVRAVTLRLALAGLVLNQQLFTLGLARTSAVESALLAATIPIATAFVAMLGGRERLRGDAIAGLALALVGAVVVARPDRLGATALRAHLLGDALIAVNVLCYGGYLVWAREELPRHGTDKLLGWMFAWAALLVVPFGASSFFASLAHAGPRVRLTVLYVVLGPTIFAYGLNAWALRRAPASLVAAFTYLQPVGAVLLAVFFGDSLASWLRVPAPRERFTLATALGMALILAGVTLSARRKPGTTKTA